MIDLKEEFLEVQFQGAKYRAKLPTVRVIMEVQNKFEKNKDFGAVLDFLETLNIPKDVTNEMQVSHIETIMEGLTKPKKK